MVRKGVLHIKLINKYKGGSCECFNEFFCDITDELDRLAEIKTNDEYYSWRHYILADKYCKNERCLAIRIPGGTVGGVWLDKGGVITRIEVDTNYVVKTYPKDVNELIKKFIGCKIEGLN